MEIREMIETELIDLLKLYRHLHTADEPLPPEDIVEGIWRQICTNENLKYYGLFKDSVLTSSCTLSIIPNLTRGCRPYGVIENVVTHPNFRRKGFGKAVLMYALDRAWRNGCYKVMLLTGRKDEATFRFYESAGFNRNEKQAFIAKAEPVEPRK